MPEPFVVAGALGAPTGLGEAARLAVLALQREGRRVELLDLTAALGNEQVVAPPVGPAAGEGPGTLLLFVNPPAAAFALARIGRRLLRGKVRVGCFVWEYPNLPAGWRRQAALFHALVGPSPFSAEILSAGLDRPVAVLPHPVAVREPAGLAAPAPRRDPARPFTVLFVGDAKIAGARKNPEAVVRAVGRAFGAGGPAVLRLVLRGAQPESEGRAQLLALAASLGLNCEIDDRLLDEEAHRRRFAGADVFVSLHRTEGFGLAVAEAMLAGLPVIASDYGATRMFLDEATGFPVPVRLVPAVPNIDTDDPGPWAEPDVEAAARALRLAFDDPDEARRRAEAGRARVLRDLDARAFVGALDAI